MHRNIMPKRSWTFLFSNFSFFAIFWFRENLRTVGFLEALNRVPLCFVVWGSFFLLFVLLTLSPPVKSPHPFMDSPQQNSKGREREREEREELKEKLMFGGNGASFPYFELGEIDILGNRIEPSDTTERGI